MIMKIGEKQNAIEDIVPEKTETPEYGSASYFSQMKHQDLVDKAVHLAKILRQINFQEPGWAIPFAIAGCVSWVLNTTLLLCWGDFACYFYNLIGICFLTSIIKSLLSFIKNGALYQWILEDKDGDFYRWFMKRQEAKRKRADELADYEDISDPKPKD